MSSAETYVSLRTASYSGATLFALLAGSHPDIATIGELNGFRPGEGKEDYRCSCSERLRECAFWQAIERSMHERGFAFDIIRDFDLRFPNGTTLARRLRRGSFGFPILDALRDEVFNAVPSVRRQMRALVEKNEAMVHAILELTGSRIFIDTSKERLRFRYLRRFGHLEMRAIHFVRDVRGVISSRLKRGRSGSDVERLARDWVKLQKKAEVDLRSLPPSRRLVLRYEDLCNDVTGTLRGVYEFLGVDPERAVEDYRSAPHHVIGNPMRLRAQSEIRLDEQWKERLVPEQLATIRDVASTVAGRYGYHLSA